MASRRTQKKNQKKTAQAWPPVTAHEIEGLHPTHPSHAIRDYIAATNEGISVRSTQYAVRREREQREREKEIEIEREREG